MRALIRVWLERVLIALGILSFWPWILGHRGVWYQLGLVCLMVALCVVAVARVRRIKRAFEKTDLCETGRMTHGARKNP
jgi:hypothetical protein